MRERLWCLTGAACLLAGLGCESEPSDGVGAAGVGGSAGSAGAGGSGGASGSAGSSAAGTSSAGVSAGGAAAGSAGTGGLATGGSAGSAPMLTGTPIVFVGGYGSGYPLRAYDLDKTSGALVQRGGDFDAGDDPSYLALDPSRTHLYAANENDGQAGGVTALTINADGSLTRLNHQTGSDMGLTHLAVDPSGKFVLGASYGGGSVSVFPLSADGSLGAELDNVDFGSESHAHCVAFDPTGKYAFIPTLGLDQVQQLQLAANGTLTPNSPANVESPAGAGPRHIAVHPSGKLAFVMNELNDSVTPFQLAVDGKLTAGATVSSLPDGFNGQSTGAHVELSPDGRFVYVSNRGHDSIAVFSADQTTGALTLVEHEPTRGETPRDFDVDPNGDVLIVANQNSATLSVYAIGDDGGLTPLGQPSAGPPSPSAVQIHYLP